MSLPRELRPVNDVNAMICGSLAKGMYENYLICLNNIYHTICCDNENDFQTALAMHISSLQEEAQTIGFGQ